MFPLVTLELGGLSSETCEGILLISHKAWFLLLLLNICRCVGAYTTNLSSRFIDGETEALKRPPGPSM